ncbi:MAG: sigma 54-interacting transcriptional regulator [Deltaproteobacteria bacterium]|nr:sigma 54-interacting transcriptional regulator [Deltaproteobacteria bacterium]
MITDYVRRYCTNHPIDLQTSYTALHDAIPPAKRMEAEGVEVILAGQGTGSILRENVHLPIVTFSRNSFDYIRALQGVIEKGKKKVLVPLYKAIINEIDILEEFFGIEIDTYSYEDAADLKTAIQNASQNGFDTVLGSGLGIIYARDAGLTAIEASYNESVIQSSLETAISVIQANREEQEKAERYRCIINATSDGIIASDKTGRITSVNNAAIQLLELPDQGIIGQPVARYLPKTSISRVLSDGIPIYDSLEKVNRKSVVCNHHPIMVEGSTTGCVTTLNEISTVIRAENKIRRSFTKAHTARYVIDDLLYKSDIMHEVVSKSIRFAKTDSNLLLSGETGTGKEILAQSIHNLSIREKQPFVSINCAALPDQLLESELFGYEEGAFTGSRKGGKPGLFEIAHKGTIFLDEIGETPENVQIRLLRVLQEREIMRLGADQLVPIDVRVIAASNKDLGLGVHNGSFREDLFFRLNVLRIHLPPLRQRLGDIPVLTNSFIKDLSQQHGISPINIPETCFEKLMNYKWPGNVRQLRNFTERIILTSPRGFTLNVFEELYSELMEYQLQQKTTEEKEKPVSLNDQIQQDKRKKQAEELKKALEEAQYSKSKAAEILGISRTTLWKRLKKTGLT